MTPTIAKSTVSFRILPTARELMKLPLKERRAALATAAKVMASLYDEDLAKPVHARELTAFTALDCDPILEGYIPEDYRAAAVALVVEDDPAS